MVRLTQGAVTHACNKPAERRASTASRGTSASPSSLCNGDCASAHVRRNTKLSRPIARCVRFQVVHCLAELDAWLPSILGSLCGPMGAPEDEASTACLQDRLVQVLLKSPGRIAVNQAQLPVEACR